MRDSTNETKRANFESFTTGGGDSTVTLSKETILDVNMQELNSKFFDSFFRRTFLRLEKVSGQNSEFWRFSVKILNIDIQ